MKVLRICHLRNLNRFELRRQWTTPTVWKLRPRGFDTVLLRIEAPPGTAIEDLDRFFNAVMSLCDTPAPERRGAKRRRNTTGRTRRK